MKPTTILENVQQLYDRNEFLAAYNQTKELWEPATALDQLSVEELILAGRLSVRLGGRRLWRWLLREALRRAPDDPQVRYFSRHHRNQQCTLLEEIRGFPSQVELDSFTPNLRASYLASHALRLATLRDFSMAHHYIQRAYASGGDNAWTASCRSDILGLEDNWPAALKAAEESWFCSPGSPFAAHSLGEALVHLGRVEESAERLGRAATLSQSYELVLLACWHQCALAETLDNDARIHAASEARALAETLSLFAPLADREAERSFARAHLDIALLADEQQEIARWVQEVKSPFHRAVLHNAKHAARHRRIRLSHLRTIQKHQTCLPTSMASVLSVFGATEDSDQIAQQITFGGTSDWAAAEWLEKNGYAVRFFIATPKLTVALISHGIPFVLTLEGDHNSHAVAVIGVDESASTFLVHDPLEFRTNEYLLETLNSMKAPLGPRAMIAVPPEKLSLVDELLPMGDVELMTAATRHQEAVDEGRPGVANEIVARIANKMSQHPGVRCLQALAARYEGRSGEALQIFQELYAAFPESPMVRSRLMDAYRSAGDRALLRSALQRIVEDGTVPGMEVQQDWVHPPARYICEYADILRRSAETSIRAEKLLNSVIRREPQTAEAWHILADLLWDRDDRDAALLCYRFGSCLAPSVEHYAIAYCDALGSSGRKNEGITWLEQRARSFGHSFAAIDTWVSWIGALEDWGYPERALAACEESLAKHPAEPQLLSFVVPLFARMGEWERAAQALESIPDKLSPAYLESAAEFHRMKGDLAAAIDDAEQLIEVSPGSSNAKRLLLELVEKRDGPAAGARLAQQWVERNPGNDYLEEICLGSLDRSEAPAATSYRVLARRLNRNLEDGWAWREFTFRVLSDYRSSSVRQLPKLVRRITRSLVQCVRTSADEAGTIRAQAEWLECRGDWEAATTLWLRSIERDPTHMYGYRHAIDCSSRFTAERRLQVWRQMHTALRQHQGRWSNARTLIMLGAERFGVSAAEDLSREWLGLRPDDPEVIEAAADLLLTHGHGRSDAQRALELLLPAVPRFPFHFGMRLSLSDAYRDVGDSTNSERVLREIVLRHPDNSGVKVQLALARERRGDVREALALLASAAVSDPRDSEIAGARAGILIRASRISDARSLILECLQTFPENVQWRRRAVDLLMDCGDEEAAVGAARTGVDVHPKGAYLWMLLGETLNRAPSHAAPGEIEQCFRRSVDLNAALFEAADWLSIVLVRQRRYPEAREVIDQFVSRMPSPCAAQGRLAWIWRSEGKNADATEDMVSLVKASPWYSWGWLTLIEWLEEDRAWEKAVALLSAIPEEMRTNREFRRRRLSALEAGGRPAEQLDAEWDKFLKDFPEDISLHLIRYDSLSHGKRFSEAKDLLDRVEPLAVENAYLLARRVEIQGRESQKDAAIETLLRVFFMEIEESIWPANHAWELIQDHHWEKEAYQRAVKCMETGQQPTRRAVFLLACHAARTGEHASSRSALPLIESIFPSKPARELKKLLLLVSKLPQVELSSRAIVLARLTNIGHHRIVVRYWTSNREQLRDNVACWAEVGRALIGLGRKPQARALMHDWRQRKGVAMWMITNYVLTFSSLWRSQLNELSFACRDALAGLQHDHCAKYLAHRLAHAAALLGRQDEFLSIWNTYRNYFDERLEEKEYFRTEERHLISTLPRLGEAIGAGHLREYRKQVKRLQRRRYAALITMKLPSLFGWRLSWWRLIWIALALLVALSRFFSNSG